MPLPEQLFQDVRVALRSLAKDSAFTVVASAVLAIGICHTLKASRTQPR